MPSWVKNNALTLGIAAAALIVVFFGMTFLSQAPANAMTVYKSPTCGCCAAWIDRMREAGFAVTVKEIDDMTPIKIDAGITEETVSCHTAFVDGYVFEGHIPAEDILRFLAENPDAKGLAVAGMPLGSPGMDFDDEKEPYDVILIGKDGSSSVYAHH